MAGVLRAEDGRLRAGWRVAAFLAAFLALSFAVQGAALVLLAGGPGAGRGQGPKLNALFRIPEVRIALAILTLPAVLGLTWAFRRLLDRRSFRSLGFRWSRSAPLDCTLGLLMGAGLVLLTAAPLLAFGWCRLAGWGEAGGSELYLALVGLAAAALVEETVCRGYVQSNLAEGLGPLYSLVIASLLFAALHSLNEHVQPLALFNIFLAGLLLGLLYHRFRNLWAPWAVHFAWNFTMGPLLGMPVSGTRVPSLLRTLPAERGEWLFSGGPFGFEGGLAATVVIVLFITGLLLWKGRPAGALGGSSAGV